LVESVDVSRGDIGVGAREIGYLYGQYRRMRQWFTFRSDRQGLSTAAVLVRPEATGTAACISPNRCFKAAADGDRRQAAFACSGSGNVAQFCRT